jgi:SAM-dependent methyltransferase
MKFIIFILLLETCNSFISPRNNRPATMQRFGLLDYTHYLDYLPYRQEGLVAFEDFRTAAYPPTQLRNRKMDTGNVRLTVDTVLANPIWPSKWPYGPEDFRPLDYHRDDVINTGPQYSYSQSLLESDQVQIIPGLLRLPIRRHFIMPKDKFALSEHMGQYFFDGAKVLELFSCYDSILPPDYKQGPTVGVGWSAREMSCNPALDDYIEQDISVDPYLPLADNYFDFVVIPAMFQLFQRPKQMFEEINRVLKPGGVAFVGVKLAMWSFLGWKQGRYYMETSYIEDVLALGSFFHYAGGYSKPEAFDLTLPELNLVGKVKDVLFPQPRLDFYACVQVSLYAMIESNLFHKF